MERRYISRAPEFVMTVRSAGADHELRLSGELDIASAGCVRRALAHIGGRRVVMDVSGLRFIDAAGLSAIALATQGRDGSRRVLSLRGARGLVRRVIELGELGHLLDDAAA